MVAPYSAMPIARVGNYANALHCILAFAGAAVMGLIGVYFAKCHRVWLAIFLKTNPASVQPLVALLALGRSVKLPLPLLNALYLGGAGVAGVHNHFADAACPVIAS